VGQLAKLRDDCQSALSGLSGKLGLRSFPHQLSEACIRPGRPLGCKLVQAGEFFRSPVNLDGGKIRPRLNRLEALRVGIGIVSRKSHEVARP
jgi:hypothetical protein